MLTLSERMKYSMARDNDNYGRLPEAGDTSLVTASERYWLYRGGWREVNTRYQSLVSSLPQRLQNSQVFFGLEVEVEDVYVQHAIRGGGNPPGFFTHPDGSLRNGIEYVTQPLPISQIILAMANLERWLASSLESPPVFSWRTSNHVHLNVRDMTWGEIGKLTLLYSIFELQMFKFAGQERENSIFCVPITKSNLNTNIYRFLTTGSDEWLTRGLGWDKYSSLGMFRLFDLGTIEFRHFPGGFSLEKLTKWISLILSLRVAASTIEWPHLLDSISNLNTVCNYRDLQTLVFGKDLSECLGTPESSVQMLSNGVTFAKKCIVPVAEPTIRPAPNSGMWSLIADLKKEQSRLSEVAAKKYQDLVKKTPSPSANPPRARIPVGLPDELVAALNSRPFFRGGGTIWRTPMAEPARGVRLEQAMPEEVTPMRSFDDGIILDEITEFTPTEDRR